MSSYRIQFQRGLSLSEFVDRFGLGEQVQRATDAPAQHAG